jgi:hypothetical protein
MRDYSSKPAAAAEGGGQPQPPADEYNPLEGVTFTLDGVTFECKGRVSILDTSELAAAAEAAMDTTDPAGMAIISGFLKTAFGPVEYRRFRAHQRGHSTPDETVLDIISGIVEEVELSVQRLTGRPTQSPSGSLPGQQGLGERASAVIGLQGGDVSIIPAGRPADPDLAKERDDQLAAKREAQASKRPARRAANARITKLG